MNNMQNNAVNGVKWTGIEQVSIQIANFIFGIVLARLLLPSDFGLIGMISIFLALSDSIVFGGFSQALIRKSNCSDDDFMTSFFYNVIIAIALYFLLYFIAPFISHFYNLPQLTSITRVLSLVLVINSVFAVPNSIFQINLNFKIPSSISIIVNIFRGLLGILLAFLGFGVWSIVYSQVFSALLRSIITLSLSTWKFKFIFSIDSFKELFSFGSRLMVVSFLDQLFKNIYQLIIGKFFSANVLGYFSKARSYASLPAEPTSKTVGKVAFPILCKYKNDKKQLLFKYRQFMSITCYIIFPIMLMLILLAKPLIVVLLTEKWLPILTMMQILCVAQIFYPMHALNLDLLQVLGRSDLLLRVELIKKIFIIIVITIIILFSRNVISICISQILISIFSLGLNTYYTSKILNYGLLNQLQDLKYTIISSLIMLVCVYFILLFINNPIIEIFIGGVSGIIIYYLLSLSLKVDEIKIIHKLIKDKFTNEKDIV